MEYESRVNERQIQTTEEKTDTSNALDALDASSVIIKSNGTESKEQDTSSRSGNDAHADDADIRPIYMKSQWLKTTELSNQSLESENVCLKKSVAQCQQDFAKLEAHCINLELQMQNNVLKSGHRQFLKEKSNEAKVKNDIDVTKTINIELEHSVAKLLAENEQLHKEKEHLKQTYKDLLIPSKNSKTVCPKWFSNRKTFASTQQRYSLNTGTSFKPTEKDSDFLVAKKERISQKTGLARNFDSDDHKITFEHKQISSLFDNVRWSLLKITLSAPVYTLKTVVCSGMLNNRSVYIIGQYHKIREPLLPVI
ncbi:hypothetical protein Tco_0312033 [Tanacetum coccineum]